MGTGDLMQGRSIAVSFNQNGFANVCDALDVNDAGRTVFAYDLAKSFLKLGLVDLEDAGGFWAGFV